MPRAKKKLAPDVPVIPEIVETAPVDKELTPELLEKLHELALKQVMPKDIASTLGLSEWVVYDAITVHFPHLKELKLFKDFKADIFRSLQHKATEWMLKKIPLANLKDLTYLVAILEDKIRLIEGKTTQNLGIGIRIEHLVSQKESLMDSLRAKGVPENQLDEKLKGLLALPNHASIPLRELGLIPESCPALVPEAELAPPGIETSPTPL